MDALTGVLRQQMGWAFDGISALVLGTLGTPLFLSILVVENTWYFTLIGGMSLVVSALAMLNFLQDLTIKITIFYMVFWIFSEIFLILLFEAIYLNAEGFGLDMLWIDSRYVEKVFFGQIAPFFVFSYLLTYIAVSTFFNNGNIVISIKKCNIMSFAPCLIIGSSLFLISIVFSSIFLVNNLITEYVNLASISLIIISIVGVVLLPSRSKTTQVEGR